MKTKTNKSAFALAITLVLMAFVVIVVVAYLASTRIERASASTHANRLRAKIAADSGLAAAIHVLRENTRYGNYITAMPAPSPSPPLYTEIYRPTEPNSRATKSDDYLQLNNGGGDLLVSRATASSSPGPDPRPTPMLVPTPPDAFALPSASPALTPSNSYNFNQIVKVGPVDGRLVDPDGRPAFGQWVNVRNNANPPELVGRYAFFIEDESMKLNVNVVGNSSASPSPTASPNLRVNDLRPIPAVTPVSQIQEIDSTTVLPALDRQAANTALMAAGSPGSRLQSALTLSLLNKWTSIEKFAHLLTAFSKDDNTTAKGWQRLDLNKIVADAEAYNTNDAKKEAATKIANWIRDAWTGPTPLGSLQYHQMLNDNRLRMQIAANIVDYIDQDNIPTDMGDIVPDGGYPEAVPVIGVEKIPYLVAVEIIYEASNSTYPEPSPSPSPAPIVPGNYSADVDLKIQFRFLNLYETNLDLKGINGRIEVEGVPIVSKNGDAVFPLPTPSPAPSPFSIPISSLKAVNGGGNCNTAGNCVVPPGSDGTSTSGAKTVISASVKNTIGAPFRVETTDSKPRLLSGKIKVKVFGINGDRLDETSIAANLITTGYNWSGSSSTGDFLTDATPTKGPLKVASISLAYGFLPPSTYFATGDPRYRSQLVNDRWRNIDRSDATTPATTNRIAANIDTAELNARSYGVDWYDHIGDRPLAFVRNGPMLNIGELGNISAPEYYWRTLYLQHPERPTNTSQSGAATAIPLRSRESVDNVLADLFRAGGDVTRFGALNVNTQQQFLPTGATTPILPLQGLFLGVPLGTPLTSPTPIMLTQAAPGGSPSSADRLSTGVNLNVISMTVAPTPPPAGNFIGSSPLPYRIASVSNKRVPLSGETATPDNNPPRPYFRAGETASTISRLVSASEASDTASSSSRSKVVYSALRGDPQSTTTVQFYRRDFQAEQVYREISNSITTRGNVFRVLYVGQAMKNGVVQAEYLGEAFVERRATFAPDGANPDSMKTSNSVYPVLRNRVVSE